MLKSDEKLLLSFRLIPHTFYKSQITKNLYLWITVNTAQLSDFLPFK